MGVAFRTLFAKAWRHRWTFAVPVATLLLPATIYAIRLPDVYKAHATVRVKAMEGGRTGADLPTQRTEADYTLVAGSRDRLLTQANVAPLVPILARGASADDPVAVAGVAGRVQWDRAGDAAFTVAIEDQSPHRAAAAVNKLLETFLQNVRGELLDAAEKKAAFAMRDAQAARDEHQRQDRALQAFRAEHADTLPEQKDSINQSLGQARGEVTWQEQSATSARMRMEAFDQQIARWGAEAAGASGRSTTAEETQLEAQLKERQSAVGDARKKLAEARTQYTDKWPAVQQLAQQVKDLEADVQATVAALNLAKAQASRSATQERLRDTQSAFQTVKDLRDQAAADAARANARAQELRDAIGDLTRRLNEIPATVSAMAPFQVKADAAARLVQQYETAAVAEDRQARFVREADPSDVVGYSVIEAAKAPATASGPARMRYLLTAVGIGLAIGYGLLLLKRKYEETTVATPQDLSGLLGSALVVSVPLLVEGRRPRRLPWREVALAAWVLAFLGGTALALAAHKGWVTTPDWLRPVFKAGA
jgi:predicted  nucleic acid-binding Zn-ribbon protein